MAGDVSIPTIKLDAQRLVAHLDRIPEDVRNRLRTELPALTREIADKVRAKLAPGALGISSATGFPLFRTSDNLLPAVRATLVENANGVVGRVDIDPGKFSPLVASVLESGARPHDIEAREAGALSFFWGKMGVQFIGKSVHHPGFPGAHFMKSTFDENKDDAKARLTAAVREEVVGR